MTEALMSNSAPGADAVGADEEPDSSTLENGCTSALELHNAGDGRLYAVIDGERTAVQLRQCFPWTEPTRFLSLWSGADRGEREVALVEDPAQLLPHSRRALENALATAGFVLQVTAVLSVKEEVEIRHWQVQTRQGPRLFQTHLDDWPRSLPDGALLIRDVSGDLYRLPPKGELARKSRGVLWAFVD